MHRTKSLQFVLLLPFLIVGCMARTDTPDVIIEKARLCELDENWTGAVEIYTQLIEGWPDDPYLHELYHARGEANARQGKHEQAVQDYNSAIEIDADFIEAYLQRAVAFGYLDQLDQVIDDCTSILNRFPNQDAMTSAFRLRGLAQLNMENFTQAALDFEAGLGLQPDRVDLMTFLADAQFEAGQHQLALETINRAIEVAPQSTEALIELAYILNGISRSKEALFALQRALSLNPGLDIPPELHHLIQKPQY